MKRQVAITAPDSAGLFNGLITLLQLYKSANLLNGKLVLPRVVIHDQPRFGWRGFMLDESRHFFGKQIVKELLDWMAFYKLNRFHWHLSDSQGWRIEIKKYPLLTAVGGKGNFTDSRQRPPIIPRRISVKSLLMQRKDLLPSYLK